MNHVTTRTSRPIAAPRSDLRPHLSEHIFSLGVVLLGLFAIGWLAEVFLPPHYKFPQGNVADLIYLVVILMAMWPAHIYVTRPVINRVGLGLFNCVIMTLVGIGLMSFALLIRSDPAAPIFGLFGLAMIAWHTIGVQRMLAIVAACAGLAATGVFFWAVHFWNLDLAAKAAGTALVAGLAYKIFAADIPASLRIIRRQLVREVKTVTGPLLLCALISLMIGAILLHYLLTAAHIPGWESVLGWVAIFTLAVLSFYAVVPLPFRLLATLFPGTPSPGLADVANQKVHGDAGYASAPEIDAALRDQDHGGQAPPHFRD